MKAERTFIGIQYKKIVRIALATVFILLIPLVAMQFTDEVDWDPFDFVVIGTLLFGTGLAYELATRKVSNIKYRIAVGVVLLTALVLIWIDLAVGIFGTPFSGS